jgi:D-aspartate ligase
VATLLVPSGTTEVSRPTQPRGALVTGSDYRGLGIVRSLGRRGIPVWVLTSREDTLAAHSRYATHSLRWQGRTPREQVDFLLELAEEGVRGWALIPTSDFDARLFAQHHAELSSRFTMTSPPWEVFEWADDKRRMHALAERCGVDHPSTWYPRDGDELASLELRYPVILKPATKPELNRFTRSKAWRVENKDELRVRYRDALELVDRELVMVQEIIPGGGEAQFAFAALCADGAPLATVVARRTRQFPEDFGRASTFIETIDLPEIVPPSATLLEELGLTGLVEVEYKRDPRDGRLKLLDVNPRVWGWHSVGAAAGVDFPYLLWLLVSGEEVPRMHGKAGIRWVRTSTDLPTSAKAILRGRLSLRTYLRSLRGPVESAIFVRDDARPALAELPIVARLALRRLLRGQGV